VGQGISSFQESGLVHATFIDHLPTVQVLGIFPTLQSIAAQAAMLVLAALALLVPARNRKRRRGEEPAASDRKLGARVA
jgi:high-affinity iron transporter